MSHPRNAGKFLLNRKRGGFLEKDSKAIVFSAEGHQTDLQ